MATKTPSGQGQEITPPPATPSESVPAYGGGDHSWTLQAIMEMQKTLGELTSDLGGMKGSIESMKSKVDQLVAWKNMILGGAIVLGIVISVLSFVIGKGLDYVTIKAPPPQVQQAPTQQPQQPKIP